MWLTGLLRGGPLRVVLRPGFGRERCFVGRRFLLVRGSKRAGSGKEGVTDL